MATDHPIREALRSAATTAMRSRDRAAVSVYRQALAAIDNAEAVIPADGVPLAGAVETATVGAGSTDVPRRVLSDREVRGIVEAEIHEHESAARVMDVHDADRADEHRRAAALLHRLLV